MQTQFIFTEKYCKLLTTAGEYKTVKQFYNSSNEEQLKCSRVSKLLKEKRRKGIK